MNLLIVESPKKIKKLKSILGSGWEVLASFGHFRDLPEDSIGVTEPDFIPQYVISTRSKSNIAKMRKIVKKADLVYLATDADREGEAISWHLKEVLKLPRKKYERIIFREITKTAVINALSNTRDIDFNMVASQETRRVVDRLVGYRVSPALHQLVKDKTIKGLSAGRVQSPGLRLVVERENAIEEFTPEDHYSISAMFVTDDEKEWSAKWDFSDFADYDFITDDKFLTDHDFAESLVSSLTDNNDFTVIDYISSERNSKPPSPFITSTLQQVASSQLHLAPEKTMEYAQELFGLGLITYHRTDNPNLSDDGISMVKAWLSSYEIENVNLKELIIDKPNTWKSPEGSEEAHEAIRPTSLDTLSVDQSSAHLEPLYHLIFTRTIACQMANAIFDTRSLKLLSTLSIEDTFFTFSAKGSQLVFDGWKKSQLIFNQAQLDDDSDEEKEPDSFFPELPVGHSLSAKSFSLNDHKTRPPSRYTEATLIGALEKLGIGRPSTYASILSILKKRKFIAIKKRKLHATDLGSEICKTLIGHFNFIELEFTRLFEETLDRVARGEILYRPVVARINDLLSEELKASGVKIITPVDLSNNPDCPKCKKGKLVQRLSKGNPFWGCSRFSKYKCKVFIEDIDGSPNLDKFNLSN